ncbi:hypothetical protein RIR_jg39098.t1 [Rhizophagus irregularis DAOM 181602=DAOM 197198]|nr:hypothetical protein RIR_jg39098.t1 [Rhizophagus irregularis DAOM 181602=DAOM 197198]
MVAAIYKFLLSRNIFFKNKHQDWRQNERVNCQKEYFSSSYFGLKFDSKYATNVSQISLIAALISVPSIISNPRQLLALN